MRFRPRSLPFYCIHIVVALLIGFLTPEIARAGQDSGRDGTVPTGFTTYYGQTQAQVNSLVSGGQRLITIKQTDFSATPRYTVTTVTNSGFYQEGWWYYYGITEAQVNGFLSSNTGRLVCIDAFDNGAGATRFNVIMVSNTGANAKAYWWYYGVTPADIGTFLSANNARLVELRRYDIGGNTRFSCIMIRNTGTDQLPWGWYYNTGASTISDFIANNNQRIISISVANPDVPTFDVCLEQNNTGTRWYWYYGIDDTQLIDGWTQLRCRPVNFERYTTTGGVTRNLVTYIDNDSGIRERVGNIMSNYFGAFNVSYGLYLKEVNGSVLANLQGDRIFEPASTIKTLAHVHTMKQVQNGVITMSAPITVYQTLNGSCPVDTNPASWTLLMTLQQMMQVSDNRAMQAIMARWGRPAVNATATALGMTDTLIQHRLGCGSDAITNPNHLTLVDIGRLHEQVSNGYLNAANRDLMRNIMQNTVTGYPQFGPITLGTIITQEANAQGLSPGDRTSFTNACRIAWKAGNYVFITTGQIDHVTLGGWCSLPFRAYALNDPKEFVFGAFVNNTTTGSVNAGNGVGEASAELLREQVRAAIHTWACRADYNVDGSVDFFDYLDFVDRFANNRPGADFNADGVIDFFDYLDFVNLFAAGC